MIQFLPDSWETVKSYLTFDESIRTFVDVNTYCELDEEHLEACRPHSSHAYSEESSKDFPGAKPIA